MLYPLVHKTGLIWRSNLTEELIDHPIRAIATAVRNGATTFEGIITLAVERHGRFGTALDAYKYWDEDRAIAEARAADAMLRTGRDAGALMGLPISIKDIYGVQQMPTFAGTTRNWSR